jgi:NADH:ubiquinone reductase (H+-translocating)
MTSALACEAKPLIVVGAGYAGILCANRIARKRREPVLLVTEHDSFLHRVRLHETAARGRVNTLPLRSLLHPRVQPLHARAVGLDAQARQLQVRDHAGTRTLDYHKLVLALGSNLVAPFATSAPHALALTFRGVSLREWCPQAPPRAP